MTTLPLFANDSGVNIAIDPLLAASGLTSLAGAVCQLISISSVTTIRTPLDLVVSNDGQTLSRVQQVGDFIVGGLYTWQLVVVLNGSTYRSPVVQLVIGEAL